MNKIIVTNDEITKIELDNNIELNFSKNKFININSLNIKVLADTTLEIEYFNDVDIKLEVIIEVLDYVKFSLFEKKTGCKSKVQCKYNLCKSSSLDIFRFNDITSINESDVVLLNGENSTINMFIKTISKNTEKYDIRVYHNASFTKSSIKNHGVVIQDGSITINVSSFVPKKIINCEINQDNRIINFTNNKCIINPNLFIDENDVIANHSAHIGTFTNDELFYLQSRGIDKYTAEKILTNGFLVSDFDNIPIFQNLTEVIEKYWR
ncbi:MAG TPA: hypothetical protein GX747_04185 [Tenericutes bacterium]|nr:hypothetical protein [Mycoplasmatota bacterium]